jgi:phage/plasmid-associated DNA primase
MTNKNEQKLKPGEIRLDYIPVDWPLTPLGSEKNPYVAGWQSNFFSVADIEPELLSGDCKAIGLISGPVYNYPYGLVWVDVDGETVYPLVKELAGVDDFNAALPPTLTICSGKPGRERKLYKIDREKHKHFLRNKYVWYTSPDGGDKEKLEILWKRHQGVLMGLHPSTDGYFTPDGMGYEWVDDLPELPDWVLQQIITKNVKLGVPAKETQRVIGPGFVIQAEMDLETDIKKATDATWALPPESADDYDLWISIGQILHELDDSLLEVWDEWSKQSDKYKEGECQKRWLTFVRGGGRGPGSLYYMAKENGWSYNDGSQEHKALLPDDQTLDYINNMFEALEKDSNGDFPQPIAVVDQPNPRDVKWLVHGDTSKNDKKGTRNPSYDQIAEVLLQEYQGNLLYSQSHGSFFIYEHNRRKGLWCQISEAEMKGDIRSKFERIKTSLLPSGYSMKLINDVMEQLRITVIFDDWYEGKELLLFENGVLNIETKEFKPSTRDLYITQQLPYQYDPYAKCEPIIQWLKGTQENNWSRTQVLRAWLRAVLLGYSEIQKFVEIVGPGKSGKSTYANLAHALVGDENAMISSLEHLEKNRFETSNLYKKKLLLFNDVERYGGSVSVLKAITGRDLIRNERKFQAASQKPFKFNGLVMITANEPIQTTDPTSGLARRRLTIPFDKPFTGSSAEQKTLIDMDDRGRPFGEFASLLPGLVNWVLEMPELEMREYLMETNKKVDFFAKHHKEQILKSNQIMDWMSHCIIFDPGASSAVGLAKTAQGTTYVYSNWDKWLYASYCEFSRGSNSNILGRSRFETLLMDVCVHQLGLDVYKMGTSRGLRINNIATRASNPTKYGDFPSIVEVGLNKAEWEPMYGDVLTKKKDAKIEQENLDF